MFAEVAVFMSGRPGCLGYTLSRATDAEDRYVNIARWTDAAALRAAVAHPDFAGHVGALRAVAVSESRLYADRLRFRGHGAAEGGGPA
ncbi:hypothetical protein GCM10010123_28020 [Pilimelia anulata]|uniref:ABM domain-containing protein n=1 Tax=Pilimelia anulata TaxID=53371 RepID=A0A8J3FDJ7_9ACTN|nr:hypothetical protein GCM10010123_28020 [Pilimelia anulata]